MSYTPSQKIAYLEGLRGAAALVVLFAHLKMTFFLQLEKDVTLFLQDHFSRQIVSCLLSSVSVLWDGHLPVHLFWTLSAYVLFIRFFQAKDLPEDLLLSSIFKRYVRLWIPCLASILVAYVLLKLNCFYNRALAAHFGAAYADSWLGSFYQFPPSLLKAVQSACWDTFFYFNMHTTYNNVLWSIHYEWFGSVILFALFGITRKNDKRTVMYALLAGVAFLFQMPWLLCFLLGYWLCDWNYAGLSPFLSAIKEKTDLIFERFSFVGTVLFVALLAFGKLLWTTVALPSLYPNVAMSILLLLFITKIKSLQVMFSRPFFIWLGKISFGLYLLHIPIIFSFSAWLYLAINMGSHLFKTSICLLVTLPLCLAAAHIFTFSVDHFAIRWSSRMGDLFKNKKEDKTFLT